jgi:hypothetical protein
MGRKAYENEGKLEDELDAEVVGDVWKIQVCQILHAKSIMFFPKVLFPARNRQGEQQIAGC